MTSVQCISLTVIMLPSDFTLWVCLAGQVTLLVCVHGLTVFHVLNYVIQSTKHGLCWAPRSCSVIVTETFTNTVVSSKVTDGSAVGYLATNNCICKSSICISKKSFNYTDCWLRRESGEVCERPKAVQLILHHLVFKYWWGHNWLVLQSVPALRRA